MTAKTRLAVLLEGWRQQCWETGDVAMVDAINELIDDAPYSEDVRAFMTGQVIPLVMVGHSHD